MIKKLVCIIFGMLIVRSAMAQEPEPWETVTVVPDSTGMEQSATNAALFYTVSDLVREIGQLGKICTNPNDPGCRKQIVDVDRKTNIALGIATPQEVAAWEKESGKKVRPRPFTASQKKAIRKIANEAILGADSGNLAEIKTAADELTKFEARLKAVEDGLVKTNKRVDELENDRATNASVVVVKVTAETSKATADASKAAADEAKIIAEQARVTAYEAKTAADEAKKMAKDKSSVSITTTAIPPGATPEEMAKLTAADAEAKKAIEEAKAKADEAKKIADEAKLAADEAKKMAEAGASSDVMKKLTATAEEARGRALIAKQKAEDALKAAQECKEANRKLVGDFNDRMKKFATEVKAVKKIAEGKADTGIVSVGLGVFIADNIYVPELVLVYTIRKDNHRIGIGAGLGYYFGTKAGDESRNYAKESSSDAISLFAAASIKYSYTLKKWVEVGGGVMSYWAGQPSSEHFGFGLFPDVQFNIPTPIDKYTVGIRLWAGPTYGWSKEALAEPPGLAAGTLYSRYQFVGAFSGAGGLDLTFRF
jgi:hypothetical protein